MNIKKYTGFFSVLHAVHESYPATYQFQIAFNNFVLNVFVNNALLAATLIHYFSEFIVLNPQQHVNSTVTVHDTPPLNFPYQYKTALPSAPHKLPKHEWIDLPDGRIVRHKRTNMHYLIADGYNCIAGPCVQYKNQVVNFINSRFINRQVDSGYLLGHAAAVTLNGRGVIISGNSGAGKSTLALHMLTSGADFVSNDRVLMHPSGQNPFYGTLQQPRINPGTALNNPKLEQILSPQERMEFGKMRPESLWQLEHKYDVLIPECYDAHRFIPHAPLSGAVIIDWCRNTEPMVIEEYAAQEARPYLAHMMKKNDLLYLPKNKEYTDPVLSDYIQALHDKPVFVIRGGVNFAEATKKLMNFLNTGHTSV